MSHDLIIRNGRIIDGSGMASYPADIGITGNRIVAIGRLRERGEQEIDAEGRVVCPGFIDGHTHMDAQIHWDPLGTCSIWHGVTSVIMGNCGFTLAPSRTNARDLVVRNLERAEDISPAAMAAGIKWEWETFPEWLDVIERLPMAINYCPQIGHSALRTWAMGELAFERQASEAELAEMEVQLRAALKAGAFGFTTSRNGNHATTLGQPVASRIAGWDEVRRLVGIVGAGNTMFEIAHEDAILSADAAVRSEYLTRLKDLAIESGAIVTFGLLPIGPVRGCWSDQLDMLDAAAASGGRMFAQTHCRGVGALLSFETQTPFDKLPEWRKLRARPLDEQKRLLHDPDLRKILIHEANYGAYGQALGPEAAKPDWNRIWVYQNDVPPNPLVADLAKARGVDPVEVFIDLSLEKDFKQYFLSFVTSPDEGPLLEVMRHPRSVMTFSDLGAHVSQIVDSCIHTYLLAYWTRELGSFTLEEAIRMITLAPARAWGLHDRGLLREGMIADINIFDPDTLSPGMPELAHDLPGAAPRLKLKAGGILATIVGGEVVLRNGQHTGRLPGHLLRRGRSER